MAWPSKGLWGDPIAPGSVGARQVPANPASKAASPPIVIDRFARNGKPPDVALINQMLEGTNQAVLYRTREVFNAMPPMGSTGPLTSAGAGDRLRWPFAFHTGVYTHALYAIACMVPPSSGYTSNTHSRLDIYTGAGALAASTTFTYGANPGGSATVGGWQYVKPVAMPVEGLTPDTDYFGYWYDVDNGRLMSGCVFELPSMTENFSGYLPQQLSVESSVLDVYREKMSTVLKNLWKRSGAKVLTWVANNSATAPQTTASTTVTNLIDNTSTVISSATPGFTLDMTGKDRVSQTSGVPCIMKVRARRTVIPSGGFVYLKDSAGNTIASATGFTNTAGWQSSAAFNLPASAAKYDLMYACEVGGGVLEVSGVSIYEYET